MCSALGTANLCQEVEVGREISSLLLIIFCLFSVVQQQGKKMSKNEMTMCVRQMGEIREILAESNSEDVNKIWDFAANLRIAALKKRIAAHMESGGMLFIDFQDEKKRVNRVVQVMKMDEDGTLHYLAGNDNQSFLPRRITEKISKHHSFAAEHWSNGAPTNLGVSIVMADTSRYDGFPSAALRPAALFWDAAEGVYYRVCFQNEQAIQLEDAVKTHKTRFLFATDPTKTPREMANSKKRDLDQLLADVDDENTMAQLIDIVKRAKRPAEWKDC